jgi:hypothetical protein
MTRLVVDSSVVTKWSVPEVHTAEALRYLDPDIERDAPEFLFAPVRSRWLHRQTIATLDRIKPSGTGNRAEPSFSRLIEPIPCAEETAVRLNYPSDVVFQPYQPTTQPVTAHDIRQDSPHRRL